MHVCASLVYDDVLFTAQSISEDRVHSVTCPGVCICAGSMGKHLEACIFRHSSFMSFRIICHSTQD